MSRQWYMVVSSLPRMNPYFKIEAPPISRLQLEKRLNLLPAENRNLLYAIEALVWTSWFSPGQTLDETKALYQAATTGDSPFIKQLSQWFLNVRSVLSALRMRKEQMPAPTNPRDYWISNWEYKLTHQWKDLDFGLKSIYPWLPNIALAFTRGDTAAIEDFLLDYIWRYLAARETGHYFDFEAIIIYLLRWNIIHYWSQFNKHQALANIEIWMDSVINEKTLSQNIFSKNQGMTS